MSTTNQSADRVPHAAATRDEIAALPKVTLHDHLDGGLRPGTIVELAADAGIDLAAITALPATGSVENDDAALAAWFAETCNAGSLPEYLKAFDVTTAVMQTEAGLERVAREWVLDAAAEGVIYGEVRWAPEQHLSKGLSLDDAVAAVQRGLDAGVAEAADAGRAIRVGQILCAMRHLDRSVEIAELALAWRDRGVVGFDIAGPELGFSPSNHAEAFALLAEHDFPATVHAGEADGLGSVQSALTDGHARRLGHGVRVADALEGASDTDLDAISDPVARTVHEQHITLELCPSSNLQTGAIERWGSTIAEHPFDRLYRAGYKVTVSPDNRLMSGTSVTRELELLADAFGYSIDELREFQRNAIDAAFQPAAVRAKLREALD